MKDISVVRKDYSMQSLDEDEMEKNPFLQFEKWWQQAALSEIEELNAMTLATATAAGRPSARIILLKGFDSDGFVFYSNYDSAKGKQLQENPFAALVIFWKELERQIRVEGSVTKLPGADSDEYFASRPFNSRLGAWASPQSQVIPGRELLENNMEDLKEKITGDTVERPPHWGGYLLKPTSIEFWQGRQSRLHDRILYSATEGGWQIERLAP